MQLYHDGRGLTLRVKRTIETEIDWIKTPVRVGMMWPRGDAKKAEYIVFS